MLAGYGGYSLIATSMTDRHSESAEDSDLPFDGKLVLKRPTVKAISTEWPLCRAPSSRCILLDGRKVWWDTPPATHNNRQDSLGSVPHGERGPCFAGSQECPGEFVPGRETCEESVFGSASLSSFAWRAW